MKKKEGINEIEIVAVEFGGKTYRKREILTKEGKWKEVEAEPTPIPKEQFDKDHTLWEQYDLDFRKDTDRLIMGYALSEREFNESEQSRLLRDYEDIFSKYQSVIRVRYLYENMENNDEDENRWNRIMTDLNVALKLARYRKGDGAMLAIDNDRVYSDIVKLWSHQKFGPKIKQILKKHKVI